MTVSDFGGAPKRRRLVQFLLALFLVFALSLSASLPKILKDRQAAIADARDWTIVGQRCPSVTEIQFRASPYKPTKVFEYAEVRFGRALGHVSCAEIRYDGGRAFFGGYPVCQFTGPAVLEVKTADGDYYFMPGVGRRATVSAPHGKAECVMAGNFRG